MAYNIKRIEKSTPIKGVFFFDTMIWLNIIAPTFKKLSHKELRYISFFDKIYKEPAAKIAVSSLLISEIVNRYLRSVALPLYEKLNNTTVHPAEFKTKYRSTKDFKNQYDIVCDEIGLRNDSFVYMDDHLSEKDISNAPQYPKLDFNDYKYFQCCKKEGITIVTDDEDFFVEDVTVMTQNKRLLDKYYETLIQKK